MGNKETIRIALIASAVTFVAIVIIGGGGYVAYTKVISPWLRTHQASEQAKSILRAVDKVVLLPPDEEPQVTTIINAEEIKKDNVFFEAAQDGDAALFYPTSGMIILFDLKNNKLLNMGILATSTQSVPSISL